ncbi:MULTISPECIES: BTAD domain-containing putative transcriptional regulator [Streptomyces]|uniref:AfsR family transcriptional regulator n=1 Tax=Streptomyces venezuelae TaxID=54571 RepID=A0A5P2BBF0_STRVZ|nr:MULTISPECIES: BTAD domain-containing putative transcriptional regulator [Streptomyces]MYY87624.1 tetratricopeptide repeat protein [Streptomyces sp. SID335]MYZ18057.1 tetratricopeptide repeat protein [Streptomyces sp. SID337]NDZ85770.1 tetratricopeptide repeat protein [Streptomyces sp. SID10115]NEB49807.1 tetratricopeptide repeat protein [Streptomyces sp. SID339]QES27813.1 AfsR family transcriptional regulator [Streptomyces venezuelae]
MVDVPRVPEQRRPASGNTPEERTEGHPPEVPASRFSVLGPVRAWHGPDQLNTGSPQQRALLAALLLRDGRTATASELIDALWGEEPPSQALAAVRTYASRLRKVLPPGVLVSESGGYAVQVADGALDLAVAEDLWAAAEKARGAGDLCRARALVNKALGLWDGEPLANVPGPYADTQRTRLDEWRLQLLETRLDMDLEQGCHAEAVSELTALTAAHPLRERLRELQMLALYRSGRQAEALAVYADTRRLLADELGVDPRPGLKELQQRILQADPGLAEPSAPAQEPSTTVVRPAQLPATVPDFTGRASFVDELSDILSTAEGRVMAVSALAGIGGVGKTTLAVHVAHVARAHFPDGQLYVDLQGAGARVAEPETVLGAFLRALGTADSAIPDSLEERAALYRSVLDGRRVLVLLDNARDAAQVRPLLPGMEGCAALVTSRVRMVDLAGAHLVDLDVMSPEEALLLFTRIVGEERVTAEREAALDVVAACGFLPLAIRIAASRLAARRTWTVSTLAAKLADERRRLDELQAGDLAVKATFELGYGQLEPAQARAFRLLGLADGPDLSLAAAAAVLDLPVDETEDLLESLVDTSLVESAAPGRYRYHDLVRLYARACAERDEQPPSERDAAMSRLLDFYLASAARVYAIERPGDRTVDHLEPTEHAGQDFTDDTKALDWLHSEAACILACVQQSLGAGMLRRAVDLLLASKDLAESGASSLRYEAATSAARDAAAAVGDARAEGRARVTLAQVHRNAGWFDKARVEAEHAISLEGAADDPWISSNAPNELGIIGICTSQYQVSESSLLQAIDAFRADGNHPGEASALCNLSRALVELGRTAEAIDLARQGIAVYDELGLTFRLANARYALGVVLARVGRSREALAQLTEALQVFVENRQRLWEGTTHFRIAQVHLADRRATQAAQHAEQALTTGCIGGDWMRANVLVLLGRCLDGLGQVDRARACWREALAIHERAGAAEVDEVRGLLSPLAAA